MEKLQTIEFDGYLFTVMSKRINLEKVITFDDYSRAKEICQIYESKISKNGKLDTLISKYPFSVRTKNVLKYEIEDHNLITLRDLKNIVESNGKKEFMKYRNFGKKGWAEICDALSL